LGRANLPFLEIEPSLTPKVDISEKGNEILVRADLPGIDSKISILK